MTETIKHQSKNVKPEGKNPIPIIFWIIFFSIIGWGIFYLIYYNKPQDKYIVQESKYMKGQKLSEKMPDDIKNVKLSTTDNVPDISETTKKITNNSEKIAKEIDLQVNKINRSNEEGAKIFKKVTYDPKKAITFLKNSNIWQKDKNQFNPVIMISIGENGFNNSFDNLSLNEKTVLFNFFKKLER